MDKSSLTGEVTAIRMTVDQTDHDAFETRNTAHLGTNLVEGTMTALVTACGDLTVMGRLARLSVTTKRKLTTLEKDVYYFTTLVGVLALVLCTLIVLYWIFYLNVAYPNAISLPTVLTTYTGM